MSMNRTEYRDAAVAEKDRVHTYVVWMLRHAEEASDVTQDALMRLWECRDSVRPAAARAWLLKTAHRLALDRMRVAKRRAEIPLEALVAVPGDRRAGPAQSAADVESRERVDKALAELAPRDRAVMVLRELAGMNLTEISEVLDCTLAATKVALHRARKRLRRQLTEKSVRDCQPLRSAIRIAQAS